jgi:hypothetical protein
MAKKTFVMVDGKPVEQPKKHLPRQQLEEPVKPVLITRRRDPKEIFGLILAKEIEFRLNAVDGSVLTPYVVKEGGGKCKIVMGKCAPITDESWPAQEQYWQDKYGVALDPKDQTVIYGVFLKWVVFYEDAGKIIAVAENYTKDYIFPTQMLVPLDQTICKVYAKELFNTWHMWKRLQRKKYKKYLQRKKAMMVEQEKTVEATA